jgi:chaperonin GroES
MGRLLALAHPERSSPPEPHGFGPNFSRLTRFTFSNSDLECNPTMALRPLHDRILVERIEEDEQKVGGIIIPDSAKEKPQQGKVIAIGAGKADKDGKRIPLDVKEGDTILFGKYSGQEIKVDGNEYLIMREDEVLAVVTK